MLGIIWSGLVLSLVFQVSLWWVPSANAWNWLCLLLRAAWGSTLHCGAQHRWAHAWWGHADCGHRRWAGVHRCRRCRWSRPWTVLCQVPDSHAGIQACVSWHIQPGCGVHQLCPGACRPRWTPAREALSLHSVSSDNSLASWQAGQAQPDPHPCLLCGAYPPWVSVSWRHLHPLPDSGELKHTERTLSNNGSFQSPHMFRENLWCLNMVCKLWLMDGLIDLINDVWNEWMNEPINEEPYYQMWYLLPPITNTK